MARKLTFIIAIAIGVFVGGIICLKLLIKADPISAGYRNNNRTEITLHLLAASLDSYQVQYGSFPTGDNAAILRKLCGDNDDKIVFFEPPATYSPSTWPPRIEKDLDQRLVDGWNTPIRFSFGPNSRVESAGKDKKFDTADDIIESLH
jgi:hypothetical protein